MNIVARSLMASAGDESAVVGTQPGTTGLDSRCRSETLALGAVSFCATQAGRWLDAQDGGGAGPPRGSGAAGVRGLDVDPGRVGASYRSWMHLRLDGAAFSAFDPSSGFFRARDGWVRTHANYDWHRRALRTVLGLGDAAGRQEVADAVGRWSAQDLEDAVTAAGGIAVRVRTAGEFAALVPDSPLLTSVPGTRHVPLGHRVRVLDLTRVIAGPVATRTLAALGMDVLRIDPPHRPEILAQYLDAAAGKRSAVVDLAADPGLVDDLVRGADVVVTAYRPGSLDRLGLDPDTLAERRPDLVVASLQAWPAGSRWERRRGFDSVVQAACGIAALEAGPDGIPGALSAQALDHSCGYLLAGGILAALVAGHGARVSTSLTAAGQALLALGPATPAAEASDDTAHLETVATPLGELVRVRSMWEIAGVDADVVPPGSSTPTWS